MEKSAQMKVASTLVLIRNTLDVEPASIRIIEVPPRPGDIANGVGARQESRGYSKGLEQA